jgi:hypothetical protein
VRRYRGLQAGCQHRNTARGSVAEVTQTEMYPKITCRPLSNRATKRRTRSACKVPAFEQRHEVVTRRIAVTDNTSELAETAFRSVDSFLIKKFTDALLLLLHEIPKSECRQIYAT